MILETSWEKRECHGGDIASAEEMGATTCKVEFRLQTAVDGKEVKQGCGTGSKLTKVLCSLASFVRIVLQVINFFFLTLIL